MVLRWGLIALAIIGVLGAGHLKNGRQKAGEAH